MNLVRACRTIAALCLVTAALTIAGVFALFRLPSKYLLPTGLFAIGAWRCSAFYPSQLRRHHVAISNAGGKAAKRRRRHCAGGEAEIFAFRRQLMDCCRRCNWYSGSNEYGGRAACCRIERK